MMLLSQEANCQQGVAGGRLHQLHLPPGYRLLPVSFYLGCGLGWVIGLVLTNPTTSGEGNKESGTNPKSSPGIFAKIPPGEIYNNIHPIISMPHINNMGPPPKIDSINFA